MALNHGRFTRLQSIRHDAPARALRFRFLGEEREYTLTEFAPEYPAVMAVLTGMFRRENAFVGSLDALAGNS